MLLLPLLHKQYCILNFYTFRLARAITLLAVCDDMDKQWDDYRVALRPCLPPVKKDRGPLLVIVIILFVMCVDYRPSFAFDSTHVVTV